MAQARPRDKVINITVGIASAASVGLAILILRRWRKRATVAGMAKKLKSGSPLLGAGQSQEGGLAAGEGDGIGEGLTFETAVAWVSSEGGADLPTDVKLALYGCYKQALAGDCEGNKPWSIEGGMKWEAWSSRRGLSRSEAMAEYVNIILTAVPAWGGSISSDTAGLQQESGAGVPRDPGSISFGPAVSTMSLDKTLAEATARDSSPVGVLNELVTNGDIEGVQQVLEQDPSLLSQQDQDGMTALHWAADRGSQELVAMLLDMAGQQDASSILAGGAPKVLQAKDSSGDTPLHFAVNVENELIARLLVAHGASPSAENDEGETPASLAEALGWDPL